MKNYLGILFLFLFGTVVSQSDSCSFTVAGKVLDAETKTPIPFVSVQVQGENSATHTNQDGDFRITGLCSDENILIISCVGYCDSICTHPHSHDNTSHIYLKQRVHNLETVVIEAEKGPENGVKAVSQIQLKKEDLRQDQTQSLASALSSQDGVTMVSAGSNVQLPVIHGLYGNRILILNNGIKHGFQNWGGGHAPEIDPASMNNITILKGAAGVRFGPEAIGGAIILESNHMHLNEPLTIQAGSSYQSNGRGVNTNIEVNQGFKKWGYFLNGNFTKIGDRHAPDYMLTNSGKEEKSFSFGTRYHLEHWDFKLLYSYVDQDLALLRSSIAESGSSITQAFNADQPLFIRPFSYEINEPNHQTDHHLVKGEANWWYREDAKLTFRVGRQLNTRREFDVRRNEEIPIIDLDLFTSDYQVEWKHPAWFDLEGLVGLQYFYQGNYNNPGTNVTAFIPNYKSNRFSAFLIESKMINKTNIEGGVRLDYENNSIIGRETNQNLFYDDYSFMNLTSSLGIVRPVGANVKIRSNVGSSWRTPNMTELYSFGQHGFQSSFGLLRHYFNEQGDLTSDRVLTMEESGLRPEKGYKWTNELEVNKKRNSLVSTVYAQFIQDFIFDKPVAIIGTFRGPMPVFIYDQVNALFVGGDFSWTNDWSDDWMGKLSLSYLWSRDIENNTQLINQLPTRLAYDLEWKQKDFWVFDKLSVICNPSYTMQQFQAPRTITPEELINGEVEINEDTEIFDLADAPDAYFLLNAVLNVEVGSWSSSIRVNNLLNTRYRDYLNLMRYFADEPGRNIIFSINYKFKSNKEGHLHHLHH